MPILQRNSETNGKRMNAALPEIRAHASSSDLLPRHSVSPAGTVWPSRPHGCDIPFAMAVCAAGRIASARLPFPSRAALRQLRSQIAISRSA